MDIDSFLAALFGISIGFIEFSISIKKYSSSSPSKDRGTFIFIWIIVLCSMIFTLHYVRTGYGSKIIENQTFKYFFSIPFSIILCLTGYLLRQQSIEQLGKWFTTAIRTNESQQLIDIGWYAKMRHPSYTGVLMCFLSIALLLNNWLGLVGIMIPISSVFFYRIYVEEQELEKHFGIKYKEYRTKVPNMIIPKVC
jgi:protein-S-isoprenylcysteine O-methyltransferase